MKIECNTQDITIYQSILKTYEKVFISPYSSFKEAESSLSDIYLYLNKYCDLLDNNYLFLHHDCLVPVFSFSQEFHFFLKLSTINNSKYANEIAHIIKKLYKTDIFDDFNFESNNPYLNIFNLLILDSKYLIENKISYSDFIEKNIKNLNFIFPTSDVDISSDFADLNYLNDPSIHKLKEQLYLNLLVHFIQFPEQYINVSYLFIDFIDFFSFNKNQSYSFSHLKNIFLRLNENHFNVISSLKSHPLYNLFIETLFIDYSEPLKNLDTDNTDYSYYFDFQSLNIIVHKKILIDNLFNHSNEYPTINDYFFSFKNNQTAYDKQVFKNLMIVYEKNKIENKLSIKNIENSIIKI